MKDPIFRRLLQLHPKFSDLSLGRINQLLKKIDFNEKKLPKVIHIAGTNGKGSTAAILKSIINQHGYSTHVYTTPHLVKFNERIQINSKNISNKKLLEYLRYCEKKNEGKLITFFEITTAAAFKAFQDHKADFLILEVGLGGRFDATNIIKLPKFAAITPISIDHQDFLGNSLNQIAFEKLGILNNKSINYINKQKPNVMNFIHSEIKRRKLKAAFFGNDWKIRLMSSVSSVKTLNESPSLKNSELANAFSASPNILAMSLSSRSFMVHCIPMMRSVMESLASFKTGSSVMPWPASKESAYRFMATTIVFK